MNKLQEARNSINRIDQEIAKLFEERMDAVTLVAQYKKEHQLPVLDANREQELLEKNCLLIQNKDYLPYYRDFQKQQMEVSKKYQQTLIKKIIVGYQGVEGAFSHIAASNLFPNDTKISFSNFEQVFQEVEKGSITYGVIPLENSYSGDVSEVFDWCRKYHCHVQQIYHLPVDQNLLVQKGTNLQEITTIYSHPQAIRQCEHFLKGRPWTIATASNTAMAAKYVSEQNDHHVAAIASLATAELYHLEVLEREIQDSRSNTTRFIIISNEPLKEASHFNMILTIQHEAGKLATIINCIAKHGYNMECIKSFPQKDVPWAYYFYLEVVGNIMEEQTQRLLKEIQENCIEFKLLGSYL
ncbi:MAG: prephenate dehydratase domain-containing protein [Erysipelotrichaceae bacterium]|nr:prephenate dehydratase domain-containing protein [Erysipelotrichaceae bacterium]